MNNQNDNAAASAAISKLTDELTAFKGDKYGVVVKDAVAEALMDFCNKSDRLAEIIFASTKSISDCIKAIMHGVTGSISDAEVYRRAVQFYCPDANVRFDMAIEFPAPAIPEGADTTGDGQPAAEASVTAPKIINIFDIL